MDEEKKTPHSSDSEEPPEGDPRERFRRLTGGDEVSPPARLEPPTRPRTGDTAPSHADREEFVPPDEAETMPADLSPSGVPVPPRLGNTPPAPPPRVDSQGMPLPRRAPETDLGATQVSEAAFTPPPRPARGGIRLTRRGAPPVGNRSPAGGARGGNGRPWRAWGCLLRMGILSLFSGTLLLLAALMFMLIQYYSIARTLPSVDDLRERTSQFETTRILDRDGNLLYEILDPNAGRRTYVPLEDISPYMIAATIATEDGQFYSHPGFNILAIFRAFWQNYQGGEVVSGASTITQQLVRALLFSPEEASEQSYLRKVKEAILATEATRVYSKDEILELYLNEIYYGNQAYGIEAAAETYFHTTADQLNLEQASFLAGLPQAPSVYDVYTNPDAAFARQQTVLRLMYETSAEQNCIYVSTTEQRVCVDLNTAAAAAYALVDYEFPSPDVQLRYPHWVNYIRTELEKLYDPQTIYRSGFTVYTTLDPQLQDIAQEIVRKQVATLQDRNVQSGALVALLPSTGEIIVMVGSADFDNEAIDGQINMAVSPRQPGSSIKPITYTAAFEKGWTPSTLIWDVPSEFPPSGLSEDTRPPYVPVNYDEKFHGPVTVRTALANSYNVPAVKTLNFVGVYGEGGLVAMAQRLGITTLTSDQYGLALTLGGGEVTLLELTNAYAVFANSGQYVPAYAISRITDFQGNVVFEHRRPEPAQVIRPEHAWLITSILSDNAARTPAFGPNSALNLPFPVAAKTGTTNDFRDNWTLGYTPDVAVGVWVGNPDYTPMVNTSGLTGAAPIWNEFMILLVNEISGAAAKPFPRPPGVVEKVICSISGAEPSQWCRSERSEFFASDQPPLPKEEDLWQRLEIDTWTGLRASPECDEFTEELFVINVSDPFGQKWIRDSSAGRGWAESQGFEPPFVFSPERACRGDDPRPILEFANLTDGQVVNEESIQIRAAAGATGDFEEWVLEWGKGAEPNNWHELANGRSPVNSPEQIFRLNLDHDDNGILSLRLRVVSQKDGYAETTIIIEIRLPTPTPPPTPIPSDTPMPTEIPTDTPPPPPTDTPEPSATETATPSATPSATPTP
ncbi:MAG: transglycosylase domain-containing protein [Chloroflexi bacterium]|nr:transglycosylase domain-containing protein [Chloroflexota bacterium]